MNPIDPTRLVRPAASFDRQVPTPVERAKPATPVRGNHGAVIASDMVSAGATPPVDAERVQEIRKAVEQGTYPIVPAMIADAMIAASYLLRQK